MNYYSHLLYFPNTHPFNRPEFLWSSFIGEFVAPVVALGLHKHYWCSFYGNHAKLRILTDQYAQLEPKIIPIRDALGLADRGEEKDLTLVGDLGNHRFLESGLPNRTPENRALLILHYLQSICDLYSDLLIKRPDGYWEVEKSTNEQNFGSNCLVSCMHLLNNIGQFQFPIEVIVRTPWMSQPLKGAYSIHV